MSTTFSGHFCGHCGAPLTAASAFCGRCGAPTSTAGSAYTMIAPYAGAGNRSKLPHLIIVVAALAIIGVLATTITFVATKVSTSSQGCGFYCAPDVGPRLADSREFVDTKWGFIVDYSGTQLTLNQPNPSSDYADLLASDQNGDAVGEIQIIGMKATNNSQAVQNALGLFSGDQFQDITPVEAVPGAEVGLIPATGEGYTANLVSTAGASGNPVGIAILAATHGNVTIVAAMWSFLDKSGDAPFYISNDQSFDNVITNVHFQGS
jgi:hypothetical protein